MITTVLIPVVIGLVVNEFCDVSPWLARKIVRWSAFRRYTDAARAEARAEELAAIINERPGKLLKLLTAAGFATGAAATAARRALKALYKRFWSLEETKMELELLRAEAAELRRQTALHERQTALLNEINEMLQALI